MAGAVSASRARRLVSIAVPLVVTAYAVLAATFPHSASVPLTTYARASTAMHAAELTAGLALIVAGLVAWVEPRTRRPGLLAILAGVAWFGADWDGWDHGPALVRSLGAFATPFLVALLFHLVLAFPSGRLHSWLARATVVAVYGVAAFVSVGRALVRDPFLDPHCWRNCIDNPLLVYADPGIAGALDDMWIRATLAVGLLLVATATWRLLVATQPARRTLWPALVSGILLGAVEAAYAVALLRTPLENPKSAEFSSIFLTLSFSVSALAAGIAFHVLTARRAEAAVSRLATELGEAPPPGMLRDALAAAVGDPTLEVAYWLPTSRRFVGADGKATKLPDPGHGRAVTTIVRGAQPIAAVAHDATLLGASELERELGPAARLAVENERLQAEVLAQLDELLASRARIVESGDTERRRLERDLHDGAQQRLLALSYDLRLARTAAEAGSNSEVATILASMEAEALTALSELRELAHGIYPAILVEAGLGPALASLADEAQLPVELGEVAPERYSAPVETAAYLTILEAVDDASRRQATFVSAGIARSDERLVITARDDGVARDSGLVHLADRVGALGGSVDVGATTLRAEIPCA